MPPHQPLVSASLLLTALLVASSCSPVVADAGADPHVGSPVDSGLTDGEDGADGADGTDGTDGTDDTGGEDDGSDGADGSFDYDCDALPAFNEGDEVIEHARGYHGLVFDDEGHILGWDGRNNVVRATYDGDSEVWLPGLPGVEQMARHPDGTIYLIDSSESSVVRVSTSGAREVVARGFEWVYGITLGPDGNLYVADGNVHRVDPVTGARTTLVTRPPDDSWWAHSLGFNLDSTILYVGTVGWGQLLAVPLDETLTPNADPEVWVELPGGWQDAIGVDACGNVWVPDYFTSALYRISPDGNYEHMVETRERWYGHGIAWGSGIGGWRTDTIYMPQPYNENRVREVVIGVPDGRFVRTFNGVAVGL